MADQSKKGQWQRREMDGLAVYLGDNEFRIYNILSMEG